MREILSNKSAVILILCTIIGAFLILTYPNNDLLTITGGCLLLFSQGIIGKSIYKNYKTYIRDKSHES
jgi:hypothetical protein